MEQEQEQRWLEAHQIVISEDLVAAALRQVEFLKAVDRRRELYEGPSLERAIHRYKACWLPLLASNSNESGVVEGALIVPLDCEWIWHCHRLNPVQYRRDCLQFFGKLLDNRNVVSSLSASPEHETEEIWSKLYPQEPFELAERDDLWVASPIGKDKAAEGITYDLVAAVQRQTSFCYQISRPCMSDARFLTEALARYRGFLYLIKQNQDMGRKRFCVPTYDVDLMWHSHQLHPHSYCKDTTHLIGKVLQHDDMDSDRSKGQKLDVGFTETTKQWEETFGTRYWRAGALYRGSLPQPLKCIPPFPRNEILRKNLPIASQKFLSFLEAEAFEVFLEAIDVRDLPTGISKECLFVSLSKSPDAVFSGHRLVSIKTVTGERSVVKFECEPTGELVLSLLSSNGTSKEANVVGTISIDLQELQNHDCPPSMEKWFDLKPQGNAQQAPVGLRVAISCTVPTRIPLEFSMLKLTPSSLRSCFFRKDQESNFWLRFVDKGGKEVVRLGLRQRKQKKIVKEEVLGVWKRSRKQILLAECSETERWSLQESDIGIPSKIQLGSDACIFELEGDRLIKVYWGKRLEFDPRCCERNHHIAMTAVEFSEAHPYGKAIALLDIEAQSIKVDPEWFVLPWITLAFIILTLFERLGEHPMLDPSLVPDPEATILQ